MYGFGIHIVVKILFCRQRMDATETNRPTCWGPARHSPPARVVPPGT
jgi:hypothetical protein